MKKRMIIYFTSLFALIFAFVGVVTFALSLTKTPISQEEFKNKMNDIGYKVINMNHLIDDGSKDMIKNNNIVLRDNIFIQFAECKDDAAAENVFTYKYNEAMATAKKIITDKKGNELASSRTTMLQQGKNFYIEKVDSNDASYNLVRVANTVLYIVTTVNNKEDAIKVLNALNYDFKCKNLILYSYITIAILFILLFCVVIAFLYKKSNKNPVAAFIPFYNDWVLCELATGDGINMIFLLIPVVCFFYRIYISVKLAQAFGKKVSFGAGLFLLPVIFYPILAFDNSKPIIKEKKSSIYDA